MTARNYVILHEPDQAVESLRRGGPRVGAGVASVAALTVETDRMAPAAARAILQNKRVAAVAPVLPMKLIAPVGERNVPAAAPQAGTLWGLDAVGALTSPFDGSGPPVPI